MPGRSALRLLGLTFLVGLALSGLVSTFYSQWAAIHASAPGRQRTQGLRRAADLASTEYSHPQELGDFFVRVGRHRDALVEYERAILRYPACSNCWVGIAEAELALGRDPSASIARAIRFGRSETSIRTRAAVLLARLGRHDEAIDEFAAALAGKREERGEFFSLLHRIYGPERVLSEIVDDSQLRHYFAWVRRTQSPVVATPVWERYRAIVTAADQRDVVRQEWVDYLADQGALGEAWNAVDWSQDPPAFGILGGDFEEELTRSGPFGWKLHKQTGMRVERCTADDGSEIAGQTQAGLALCVRFDGEHDADFTAVTQLVPVAAGAEYVLRARVRTEEITSDTGPVVMVTGAGGKVPKGCRLRVVSESFRLTNPWREIEIPVRVPEACRGIRVSVTRSRSDSDNRLLGGLFVIDDVRLTRVPVPGRGESSVGPLGQT